MSWSTTDQVGSGWVPEALAAPGRRLRDAVEPLAMHATGSPSVRAALAARGLGRRPAYVASRAACLGDPAPGVVAAAFAFFEPRALAATYLRTRQVLDPATLLAAREQATVRSLRTVLDDVQVGATVAVLRRALQGLPTAGRPLFAGLAGLDWPAHPLGQLWRACELVREHRGDAHVAAWLGQGLDPVEANLLTELWLAAPGPLGAYTQTRGWSPDDVAAALVRLHGQHLVVAGALTREGRALRDAVEHATEHAQRDLLAALGEDLEPLVALLADWSARCVAAGAFTSDAFTRAAG